MEGPHAEFDCTSYVFEQKHWRENRPDRPNILFELYKPRRLPTGAIPKMNTFDPDINADRLVIDRMYNQPLSDFCNLPLTLSTKVEGYLMEAWERQNPGMTAGDYFQQMVHVDIDPRSGYILQAEVSSLVSSIKVSG